MAELKTIDALVVWVRHALEQAGVEPVAQESRWLVAHGLGLESHHLASKAQELVSAEQWAHVVSLASRRAAREPLQYILGTQEFCGLEFQVSPAVLIPRPETEVLVQEVVRAVDLGQESVLVDVGTGSGCVAVALATILGNARIVAVDRSPQALAVAKGNAERHAVAEKIEWMESDLLSALHERGMAGTVDIIASNPPYIAEADWAGLQPEVREFEPRSALFSGPTGTEFHERLLRESKEFLVPGGMLVMEIGQGQCAAVRQMAERIGGYAPLRVVEDEAGIERVVIARRPD